MRQAGAARESRLAGLPVSVDDHRPEQAADESPWEAVVAGVAAETGEKFFAALVRNLAQALGVAGVWVTEYLPEPNRLRALSFWLDGDYVSEYEYDVGGTPCEPAIVSQDLVHFPDRVVELFPADPDLAPLNAVSYMGQRLEDVDGTILGHLAVLDTKPLPDEMRTTALFRVFAARAGAELRRLRAEAEVRAREEKLRRLIDSAMDAIVELDAELLVTMMNPAAVQLFACEPDEIGGESFDRFLSRESLATLGKLVDELESPLPGASSSWIPSGLQARTCAGEVFPAEATLSRSVDRERPYYTLILRNVNAKREAERRIATLQAETEILREEIRQLHGSGEILGRSPAVRAVLREIEQVAPTDSTVLITGETGTGKELVARAIHGGGPRAEGPFVPVNCAAIPANLIESELFGHEKGAFTGATRQRRGRFALAERGTLFLDEIGELSTEMQTKLLRVLQEREFEPVGSSRTVAVDVRVVSATHRDLRKEVDDGSFREDLYYRLNVFPLHVPPLREREGDVALLAESFAERYARRLGRPIAPLDDGERERLAAYDWPGNVRELQNVIERAVITSTHGRLNLDRALPRSADDPGPVGAGREGEREATAVIRTAAEMLELEKANIRRALEASGGKVSGRNGAAERLQMKPSTLASRIKALRLRD
jgi:PAS domain S-box-containing protein